MERRKVGCLPVGIRKKFLSNAWLKMLHQRYIYVYIKRHIRCCVKKIYLVSHREVVQTFFESI